MKTINGIHGIFDRGERYGGKVVEVDCLTLNKLCENLGVESIDMMKIDVEGATMEVLEGASELLDTVKIMHIETESKELFRGQRLHDDVCFFLGEAGFEMVDCSRALIEDADRYQHDSVWVKI